MKNTQPLLLVDTDFPAIRRRSIETLQVNLGYRCNLSCVHCHVNAGPQRTEEMSRELIDLVIDVVRARNIGCVDITGGAPELHPHFRYLVGELRAMQVAVIDRCNLTVLFEPGLEGMAQFLAENGVTITASLPCYDEENVTAQRGKGVYEQSIEALKLLNTLGYGRDADKPLNLVFNPVGAVLPAPQQALESEYKTRLYEKFGIVFNQLFTITNMPINRFGAVLLAHNEYDSYMELLKGSFSAANLETVMCRDLVSVDWQGYLYDCDFNQMLGVGMASNKQSRRHLESLLIGSPLALADDEEPIKVADHCYGCTAGQGSSCGGALGV